MLGNKTSDPLCTAAYYQNSRAFGVVYFPTTMRTDPTMDSGNGTNYYKILRSGGSEDFDNLLTQESSQNTFTIETQNALSGTQGVAGWMRINSDDSFVHFDAEL